MPPPNSPRSCSATGAPPRLRSCVEGSGTAAPPKLTVWPPAPPAFDSAVLRGRRKVEVGPSARQGPGGGGEWDFKKMAAAGTMLCCAPRRGTKSGAKGKPGRAHKRAVGELHALQRHAVVVQHVAPVVVGGALHRALVHQAQHSENEQQRARHLSTIVSWVLFALLRPERVLSKVGPPHPFRPGAHQRRRDSQPAVCVGGGVDAQHLGHPQVRLHAGAWGGLGSSALLLVAVAR